MPNSRERILASLRANKPPFPDAPPRPQTYLPVTDAPEMLIERFKAEAERLMGIVHLPETPQEAIETVLQIVGDERIVLSWADLPLIGLTDRLIERGVEICIPLARHETRQDALYTAETIRIGITGADAAFASTGTIVVASGDGQGRLPSLIPPIHIVLLPKARLYARLEDWLAAEGRQHIGIKSSIAFITGPSRTSDIEMQLILGVHGPGVVHTILF